MSFLIIHLQVPPDPSEKGPQHHVLLSPHPSKVRAGASGRTTGQPKVIIRRDRQGIGSQAVGELDKRRRVLPFVLAPLTIGRVHEPEIPFPETIVEEKDPLTRERMTHEFLLKIARTRASHFRHRRGLLRKTLQERKSSPGENAQELVKIEEDLADLEGAIHKFEDEVTRLENPEGH